MTKVAANASFHANGAWPVLATPVDGTPAVPANASFHANDHGGCHYPWKMKIGTAVGAAPGSGSGACLAAITAVAARSTAQLPRSRASNKFACAGKKCSLPRTCCRGHARSHEICFSSDFHAKTLELIFHRPVSAIVKYVEAMALLAGLGAQIDSSREGSRVGVVLFGEVRVPHKPHPSPIMDKGVVAALRDWLEQHGVKP